MHPLVTTVCQEPSIYELTLTWKAFPGGCDETLLENRLLLDRNICCGTDSVCGGIGTQSRPTTGTGIRLPLGFGSSGGNGTAFGSSGCNGTAFGSSGCNWTDFGSSGRDWTGFGSSGRDWISFGSRCRNRPDRGICLFLRDFGSGVSSFFLPNNFFVGMVGPFDGDEISCDLHDDLSALHSCFRSAFNLSSRVAISLSNLLILFNLLKHCWHRCGECPSPLWYCPHKLVK